MSADQGPNTAIVVGSGCSGGLGIPPLAGFLDTLIDKLARPDFYDKSTKDLIAIQAFITRIKGAAAYVRADLLNIEELYGMADMDEDLWKAAGEPSSKEWYGFNAPEELDPLGVKQALNRAIFSLAEPAGNEFLTKREHFPSDLEQLAEIKRESSTETIIHSNQGSRWANLMAYLSLASFQDRDGRYPIFIQFNWDLALDRALNLWSCLRKKNKKKLSLRWWSHYFCDENDQLWLPWYGRIKDGSLNYHIVPRLARPHGGINWIDSKEIESTHLDKNTDSIDQRLNIVGFNIYPKSEENNTWIDTRLVYQTNPPDDLFRNGEYMEIVPPTWRKQATKPAYEAQWGHISQGLQHVRRIIFIGYSLPKTDLYFRHFLALSLADNPHLPKVYVVNPEINNPGGVRENFLDLFEPLAREGRLYGVVGRFGDPALFDLHRVFKIAKPIKA